MKLYEIAPAPGAKYLYHATFVDKGLKIVQHGLKQFEPSNWVKAATGKRYNQNAGIFAFEHPEDAVKWAMKMNFDFKKDTAIVKILNAPDWVEDPSEDIHLKLGKGRSMMSKRNIPSSMISRVYAMKTFGNPEERGLPFDKWLKMVVKELSKK